MEDKFQQAFKLVNRTVNLEYFQKYVIDSQQYQSELFQRIRQVRTHGLPRLNLWRMLLQIIPIAGTWLQKKQQLQLNRKRWQSSKDEARTGIKSSPMKQPSQAQQPQLSRNPLMKVTKQPDKKLPIQSQAFLREQIKKDVDRTYQELPFFQQTPILKLLTDVLFVWCRLNPDVSYKQGMNELLATVVYVYFQEALPGQFIPNNQVEEQYAFLNSVQYAEADIYLIFEKIMQIQKQMFKQNFDSEVKGLVNPNSKNNSPILQRIIQIQDHKLKVLDLELFRIIKLQDVKTKTFLLRWIRCLHTREFGLIHSLAIWDCIFLEAYESPNSKNKHQFQFVDAMCLSMFIYMRSLVLTRETANQILKIYQKYPQMEGEDLTSLITLAWDVCNSLRNLTAIGSNVEETLKTKEKQIPLVVSERKIQPPLNDPQELYPSLNSPIDKPSKKVYFQSSQLQELISILQQSLSQKDQNQSKSLSMAVLSALSQKLND